MGMELNMAAFFKDRICSKLALLRGRGKWCPIGVDIADDAVKVVQLANNGKGAVLLAADSRNCPEQIKPGSTEWQRWAISAISELTANGRFRGKSVAAAIAPRDVFIDHIRMPPSPEGSANTRTGGTKQHSEQMQQNFIVSKIKQKLPFEADQAMIKYIPTEDDNAIVIATERKKIDRHLAIYERANLQISSISVWPMAITNTYVKFFGRRKSDIEAVVMLLDMEPARTNMVICRHVNLLFAHSISIGTNQLGADSDESSSGKQNDEMTARLILELTGCRRHFSSMYRKARIERLIFLSDHFADKIVCTAIAKQLELPAQMGDCLAAVRIPESTNANGPGIDRRECQINWATAFGLGLS